MGVSKQSPKIFEIVTVPEDLGHSLVSHWHLKTILKILKLYQIVKLVIALKVK